MTGGLFVAGGECAEAFEVMEELLDVEALAVQLAREWTAACFATGMLANDDLHTALVELLNQFTAVVGGVREESPALRVLDELLGDGGFVTLAGGQCDKQRPPSQVHDDVNLRRKTAATAT